MNIEQLEYIIEVARKGSFSLASNDLHVSPSGISQSISKLEKELGVKLFKRSRSGAVPTDEGKIIIKKAYEVLTKLSDLKEKAQSFSILDMAELKLSAPPGFMTLLLKPLSAIKNEYPNINLEISEHRSATIVNAVQQNIIDIGLIIIYKDFLKDKEDLAFEGLLDGKIKVYVSNKSPLAFHETVTPEEIIDQSLVLNNGDNMKLFYQHFFAKYRPMNILFTSNNSEVIPKAVAEGLAISFAPDFSMKNNSYVLDGEIIPINLVNYEPVNISLGWIHSKKAQLSIQATKFIKYLKSEIDLTGV
ncbi:LysR family transcriptional regulator [Bacillus sp. JJ722]|uniref:LysR family transcriptional regulator n=1 Tax=Bacillus sp. JJ722 TaxID=3122973 RepID=UPI002FFEC78E